MYKYIVLCNFAASLKASEIGDHAKILDDSYPANGSIVVAVDQHVVDQARDLLPQLSCVESVYYLDPRQQMELLDNGEPS